MTREDEIRLIAYGIWEADGYSHGHDYEHWLNAEAIWETTQKSNKVSTTTGVDSKHTLKPSRTRTVNKKQ